MKKIFTLLSLTFLLGIINYGCRNPAYELNVLFDGDVIKYKTTIMMVDAAGNPLTNLKVAVSGQDAANVYDFAGLKNITAPNGVITLGIDPKLEPSAAKPLQFNVQVTATDYDARNIPVTILPGQFSQVLKVAMLKTVGNTPASTVVTVEKQLGAGGVTTAEFSLETPTTGTVTESTEVTIPAGTGFRNAAGELLVGGVLLGRVMNFDAGNPATLEMFPGGDLSSPNVKGPDGQVGSAFFVPAGFTNIEMFVAGQEVKSFTKPIEIAMQLNPDFKPLAAPTRNVQAGDQLAVYSYSVSTGAWQFEKNATVIKDGDGKVAVEFTTDHLTIFCVGDVVSTKACQVPSVTFSAPWLGSSTLTTAVQIFKADGVTLLDEETVVISDGRVLPMGGLPPFGVRYKILNATTRTLLAEGNIADPCAGGNIVFNVGQPGNPVQGVTLTLMVKCNNNFIVPPNFDLFYKVAGAPANQFKLLGVVEKGQLKTAMLTVGTAYDFRANWGTQTKTVNNKTITNLDMSTTVGEYDYLGDKSPQYNRALLIEACKTIQ